MEQLAFLTPEEVRALQRRFGTPVFVYDEAVLEARAAEALAFPNAFGLTCRFAMKALPTAEVLRLFARCGLHIDASSGFEVERALLAGVPPASIQLTAQELPANLEELVGRGVLYNACSLHQLRCFGQRLPGKEVSVRVNPGLGSGHNKRTNVGGPSSSFGIWHEYLDEVLECAAEHKLCITGMHTHIGSGSDPKVWQHCAQMSLDIAARLPDVCTLSLGGGYKVGRMADEVSTDLQAIGPPIRDAFQDFAVRSGRELRLEIEPGTFLVANAGSLICSAMDVIDTGAEGHRFIKLDGGMTEILRPSMYGAQHPIVVVPAADEDRSTAEYLIVGHCCESGDILSPEPGNPEGLAPRTLCETKIGDAVVIEGAGAYCASMSAKNYNSFPEAPEVLRKIDGSYQLIRKRQSLAQLVANEN